MTGDSTRAAYSARAAEYAELLGSIDHAAAPDINRITEWARGISGPVLDVGCGAGQWTQLLTDLGCEAEGIDPVPEFIDIAQDTHPDITFWVGRAEDLGVPDGSLGGVLAWYSLIHTDPSLISDALTEFARCVRPGGRLALGFFTGPSLEPFDHAITTAWFWPVEQLQRKVEEAGFTVTDTGTRTDPGTRPHGAILATL
ncbi:putative methyltransferase [Corynebacterium variabile DSM 44702]|uniref:Putative methyltransferase n=1 Tax=Corynebacterium variabile (strain DSM 44702 / CIP 107183 / JCM 12073 / NCIMB 30131) TaxID=858619 RepID=G0HGF6_CORVD|nr:class I SAM-dependent methyltransferase [Corynebacterium variabile]AEK37323.1 putative methyltransferase [Corynebacterium variabile DSM 44702]